MSKINYKKLAKLDYYGDNRHVPAKAEAKELRKIKAETGLSEKQIRKQYHFRVRLAEAAKPREGNPFKIEEEIIKKACKETKLAKSHPDTLAKIKVLVNEHNNNKSWYSNWYQKSGKQPCLGFKTIEQMIKNKLL